MENKEEMCNGLPNDKEQMITEIVAVLKKLYWEDFEFFYKFVLGYAEKKGIK